MGISEACGQREGEGMLGEGRWERDPKFSSWTSSAAEPRELGKPTGASLVPRDATGRDKASPCAFFGPQASPLAPQGAGVGGQLCLTPAQRGFSGFRAVVWLHAAAVPI